MSAAALFVAYAWASIFVVIVLVICCLQCQCIIPLGRLARCLFDLPCCKCGKKDRNFFRNWGKLSKPQSVKDAEARETAGENSDEEQDRSTGRRVNDVAGNDWGCCATIPFLVTCGFCCGALKETPHELPSRAGIPVAQPVDEVVGTEAVVAVSMPLLRLS